jgi:formate dehydrogenase subunit delta
MQQGPNMDPNNLVVMANRIGGFFDAMPDKAEALDGVFQHLRKFWAPPMRQQLLRQVEDSACASLHPLVAEVLATRGGELRPPP